MERWLRLVGLALLAVLAAPIGLVVGEGASWTAGRSLVPAFEARFGPVCHHLPERTLAYDGRPLPVCARCTGMWLGAALGGVGLALPPRRRLIRGVGAAALAAGALGLGAALAEALGWLATSNGVRAGLGLLLGAGPAVTVGLGARIVLAVSGRRGRRDPRRAASGAADGATAPR